MSCGRARTALGLPSSHRQIADSRKHADFWESRVTALGTHQCCILATQGKITRANHVPITHLNFVLSMSFKVKCDTVLGLTLSVFSVVCNSSTWPNSAPLRDISFQNLSNLGIDLLWSLRSNVIAQMDSTYTLSY